uniref:Uncharacterized protein n=1 Tax=Oryza sativa subsp. japonica TaxID=39947 RepID=Q2QTC7_ORYSJ|nr:hypothetical protein LOC_Os12g20100 [Oryza sativa Japonica Group]
MAREAPQEASSSSPPVQKYGDCWDPTVHAPGWTQFLQHDAGGSSWQSASDSRWYEPQELHWGYSRSFSSSGLPPSSWMHCSISSRGDLGKFIRGMDTLELQAGNMQHMLEDHVVQSREWQQTVDAQLANFNTMIQQQQVDWQAFHRYQGFDPRHEP